MVIQRNVTGNRAINGNGNAAYKAAYSVDEFCSAHSISRSMFYLLLAEGKGPRTMAVGARKLISCEAAAEWRRQMEDIAAEPNHAV